MRPRPKNLILKSHRTNGHTNCSTTSGEETSTADNLISELQSNRIKRAAGEVDEGGGVLRRACNRFQIEVCIKQCTTHNSAVQYTILIQMLLIPIAIAMMPIVLCSLFLCTCCCGEKEARGSKTCIAKLGLHQLNCRQIARRHHCETSDGR